MTFSPQLCGYAVLSKKESIKSSVRRSNESQHREMSKITDEFLEWVAWERLISEVGAERKARPSSGGRIAGKSQLFAQHLFVLHMHNKAPS